jgi:hypothetical protein
MDEQFVPVWLFEMREDRIRMTPDRALGTSQVFMVPSRLRERYDRVTRDYENLQKELRSWPRH